MSPRCQLFRRNKMEECWCAQGVHKGIKADWRYLVKSRSLLEKATEVCSREYHQMALSLIIQSKGRQTFCQHYPACCNSGLPDSCIRNKRLEDGFRDYWDVALFYLVSGEMESPCLIVKFKVKLELILFYCVVGFYAFLLLFYFILY